MALLTFVKNGIADAGQAAHRIGDAGQDVGAVAKGVSSGEMSMSEGIGLYGEAAELRDNTKVFQEEYEELTQKLNEGLGDGSVGEKGMQDTIVEATNVIQDQQGVEEGNQGETYIYDGSGTAYKGFRDKETDDIGINVGEGGTNLNDGSETYSVMVHEVSHQNGADETKAHFLTDVAADSWNTENQFNGYETNTSKVNQGEWLNDQYEANGRDSLTYQHTIKASQVDEFDPYMPLLEFKKGGGELISQKDSYYSDLKKNNPPKTIEEAKKTMIEIPPELNIFHTYDNEETVKFLSKDGHTEGIYNIESGFLTKNPKNRATYNKWNPNGKFQKYLHVGEDVVNYFFFGTGPDDSTNMFERLEKTFDDN